MARFAARSPAAIEFDPAWDVLSGHGYGLRGPLIRGTIGWPDMRDRRTDRVAGLIAEHAGAPAQEVNECLADGCDIRAFLALIRLIESLARSPVSQPGVLIASSQRHGDLVRHRVAVPFFEVEFTRAVMHWLRDVLECATRESSGQAAMTRMSQADLRLKQARERLHATLGSGVNNLRLVKAADEMRLPWRWLPGSHVHVGAGRDARLFSSTLTEATPAIGVNLARSKAQTAVLLALGGLPVPRHFVVGSVDDALAAAQRLGYPVVVKPEDRDRGEGVHAGLADAARLREAYEDASSRSSRVLVEEHVPGEDYRLTVQAGRVVKAIVRRPGGVVGDGRRTVARLVDDAILRAPPRRPRSSLVSLDDEAMGLLRELGMTADSTPEPGVFVALRRRANMSTGGTSEDVSQRVHPDNASLAIRAAQALRLDVAGVDLIMPDISRSWLESRAAICEVNAIPQLSTEFAPEAYRDLLRRMIPGRGRLRAVLCIELESSSHHDAVVTALADALAADGEHVLSVRSDGAWLGSQRRGRPDVGRFVAARCAEFDPEASAAVVLMPIDELLARGSPWHRIDEMRILGADPGAAASPRLDAALVMLRPHLEHEPVFDAGDADRIPRFQDSRR